MAEDVRSCKGSITEIQRQTAMCWQASAFVQACWHVEAAGEWIPSKNIIHLLKTFGPLASQRVVCSCYCQAALKFQAVEVCWCPFTSWLTSQRTPVKEPWK